MKTKAKGIGKIAEYLKAYILMTAQMESVKTQQEKMKEYLVRYMKAKELEALEMDGMKVALVAVNGFKFNEDILKENVSTNLFNLITSQKVDVDKFRSAVLLNRIDLPATVGHGVEATRSFRLMIKEGKPVIKKVLVEE